MVPKGWEISQLKDLIEGSIKNGFSPNPADSDTGYWVLGLGALGEDGIVASEIKAVFEQFLCGGDGLIPSGEDCGDFLLLLKWRCRYWSLL